MASLKQKTVSSVKWQMINRVSQKGISVITFAILARILEPATFGLFALAFVALNGLQMFKNLGLDAAVIQRKDHLDVAAHTANIIIQGTGVLLCVVCYFLAPYAAIFFKNDDLKPVVQALGLIFIFMNFAKIPSALLAREMRFKVLAVIELIGSVVNSVFAVGFAIVTPTVWALVWAYVIKQIVMALLTRYFSPYRFKWIFDMRIAKELFGFGKFLIGGSIFSYLAENLNNIVVGKLLGTTLLGYFVLAANIAGFINSHFTFLVTRVLFPAYSTLQTDICEVKRVFLKVTKFLAIVSIPACVGLIAISRDLVLTIYGSKWAPIIPVINVLAVHHMLAAAFAASGPIYMALGKPKYGFWLGVLSMCVKIPMVIFFTRYWGVMGTAWCSLVVSLVLIPIGFAILMRLIQVSIGEFLKQLYPSLCAAFIMVTLMIGCSLLLVLPEDLWPIIFHGIRTVIFSGLGLIVYFVVMYKIDRQAVAELKSFFVRRRVEEYANG